MKTSTRLLLMTMFAVVILGSAAAASAQVVGGYSKVSTSNEHVTAAADFAVDKKKAESGGPLSLAEILKAEQQSVAGTNYRMCLQVKAADEDDAGVEPFTVEAVVFEKLPRAPGERFSLMSWTQKKCGR